MKYLTASVAIVASLFAFGIQSPSAEASPWTKSFGEYYVKLGNSVYRANAHRDAHGGVTDDVDFTSSTTMLYGEVGVWENLHLQAYLPLMYSRVTNGGDPITDLGFGDAELAVQSSPFDLGIPTALRLEAKLPLYGRPDIGAPRRGDRQLDFTAWLSAGGGLHPWEVPMYFYADVGYRHRTQTTFNPPDAPEYSDAFVYLAEVGYEIADTVTVAVYSSAILPLSPNPALDEAYVTAGPKLFWPVTEHIAVELDAYATPYARNSGAGWAVGAGVSLFD